MPLSPRIVGNGNRSPSPCNSTSSSNEFTPRSKRSTLGNVFSRLTGNGNGTKSTESSPRPSVGKFLPFVSDSSCSSVDSSQLVCRQVLLGHRKPVIALCAADGLLFSASKDKTIKMWNLDSEKEEFQYSLPFITTILAFEKKQRLLFTAEGCRIHVWDTQMSFTDKALKILQESKQINFLVVDSQSRLWVAFDKYVSLITTCKVVKFNS